MAERVVVVGAGLMGPGITACATLAGHPTVLVDMDLERAQAGVARTRENIQQLLSSQLAQADQAAHAHQLVQPSADLQAAVQGAFLIIEAVNENLALKRQIFQELDRLTPPSVMITSNTSGLRVTEIASQTEHPERTATTHFWFPGHLVPLVEVVMGDRTAEETAQALYRLLLTWNKAPVIVRKDLPGQLANRILQAVIREAVNIVEMGLATAEDVDTAIKMGMALRFPVWGPLEHIDAVGLDLALSVQRDVLPGLSNSTNPGGLLERLVREGNLGYKAGKGFYDWNVKDMKALAERRDRFIIEARKIIQP